MKSRKIISREEERNKIFKLRCKTNEKKYILKLKNAQTLHSCGIPIEECIRLQNKRVEAINNSGNLYYISKTKEFTEFGFWVVSVGIEAQLIK